jgi:hypothetical protein
MLLPAQSSNRLETGQRACSETTRAGNNSENCREPAGLPIYEDFCMQDNSIARNACSLTDGEMAMT